MRIGARREDDFEINVISLIDVLLTLLMFFVLSTTFVEHSRLKVNLPKADAEARDSTDNALTVVVDRDGHYSVGSDEVMGEGLEPLKSAIERVGGDNHDRLVVIRADAMTPHQNVVRAMDALGQAGFTRLSIATTPTEMAGGKVSDKPKKVSVWDARTWQTYKRLLSYTRRFRSAGYIAIIGMIIDPICLSVFTGSLKPMIDNLFVDKNPSTIFWMPIWIVGIFLVRGVASYVTDYGIAYVGRNVVQAMRIDVFAAYLRLPSTFFAREPSGQQISRITYTSEQVASASADSLKVAITEGFTVIGMLAVMLYYSPYLTMALLVLVPCVVVIVTIISRRYRKISKRIQGNMGTVTSAVEEAVAANREVRIYGGQQREAERFGEVAERQRHLNLKVSATSAASSATIQTVGAMALAMLVFLATRPQILNTISPGIFTAVLTAMGAMMPSLKRLAGIQASLQKGVTAAEDLFEIMDQPPEVDTGTDVLERTKGDIRFEDIHLVYERNDHVALRGVTLACAPGTVTALVGRSGSGKSSLVSLLPRFYQPTRGHILIDGRDYTQYTLPSLRKQIAWVGQHVVLFDDTVAANIAYGEMAGASEAEITAAAQAANAMEFIERLPEGLNTRIGQGGNSLSGGQRQRLAIARAILKNAPILVLDEATSALDTESERLIQDALTRLMRDRTTLVIAHRLSTIEHADQIAVLDQGRVVELGTHRELLDMGGQYAALHRMQFHEQVTAS